MITISPADSTRWCEGCLAIAQSLQGKGGGSIWTRERMLATRFGQVRLIESSWVYHSWVQAFRFERPELAPATLFRYSKGYFSWHRPMTVPVELALIELKTEVIGWLPKGEGLRRFEAPKIKAQKSGHGEIW